MKTSILLSAAFAAAAHSAATSGCGNPLSAQLTRGGSDKTNSLGFVTSSGVVRSYLLHIPTSYDINTPAPLAFSYHGRGATPQEQENISGMSNENFNPNYLVVYPLGIQNQWQGDPAATGYDDVGFTLELLANLSSTYCLDSSRIYAAGKSNGGGFAANILACDPQASRVFAAFAGASGAYYQGGFATTDSCNAVTVPITCNPGRYPIPVFTTHGDSDDTIPYIGGYRRNSCLPTIPRFMTEWSKRNTFGVSNTSVSLYNGKVTRYDYGNDSLPALDTHYYVQGLGHTWPSIAAGSWFDATPLLLAFWNKWTLDTTPYNFVNATASTSTVSSALSTSSASSTSSTLSTSSTITSTSSVPSASLCPSANGQIITDSMGNSYSVTCSADNSVGSYTNTRASTSYLDCMNACDAAASSGCQGFTYVGGSYGSGSGTCWLKKSMDTYPAAGNTFISAVKVSSGSSPSNSVSSVTASSSAVSSASLATSITTSSPTSLTTLSTAPTASALSCPASNNQIYTHAGTGAQFVIECGIDHQGGDMASTSVKNLEGCIAACATTSGCVDVSLSGSACYMKKTLGASISNGGILGARYIGIASASSTETTSSSPASVTGTSISASTISSSAVVTSSSSVLSLSRSSSLVSTSVSSSSSSLTTSPVVGADGYTTTTFPPACTAINTNVYAVSDASGNPYLYMCGGGSAGNTVQTITNVANWTACFQACDSYTGCTGFSYNQGAAFGNGVGQCLIKTDSPQSFVSTATMLSTRVAGYIRPITTTSSSASVASSTSTVLSTSTSLSSTSFSTSVITLSSSTPSSSVVSSSRSSSISATPSSAPIAAPSCPASNGTTYMDAGGLKYTILCTYDTSINTITSSNTGSFGDCTSLCDSTSGCTGLTWNGSVCSLKQSFGQYVLGAIKV